jgi:hypothetical protein
MRIKKVTKKIVFKRAFLSFLGIFLITSIAKLLIKGGIFNTMLFSMPVKNTIQITLLLLVFLIGKWGLKLQAETLRYKFYRFVYTACFILCTVAAIVDYFLFDSFNHEIHFLVRFIISILINPVFYLGCIFIDRLIPSQLTTNHS